MRSKPSSLSYWFLAGLSMEQCYQNNNLVCQQIRNTMNYHQHKFNVYEQHFGIPNNDIPLTCAVPPNPFNLWFPPADPYYAGLFQYTTGTVYRLDSILCEPAMLSRRKLSGDPPETLRGGLRWVSGYSG